MARLAVRRSSTTRRKTRRFPVKASRKRVAKRKTAPKSKAAVTVYTSNFAIPLNTYLKLVHGYIQTRVRKHGGSDAVAKKLRKYCTGVKGQCSKKNIVNAHLAKNLKFLNNSFKGVPGVPKNVRGNFVKLCSWIRDNVRKDIIKFMDMFVKSFTMIYNDFARLETRLKKCLITARRGNIVYTIDPSLKRQIIAFERKITVFKTKWDKRLNRLATYGNPMIKARVNQYKKQLDNLRKLVRRNVTLINQITRYKGKKNVSFKKQALITKANWNKMHNAWLKKGKELENFRFQVENYFDQLRAIKTL